jgi:hypothetical protein
MRASVLAACAVFAALVGGCKKGAEPAFALTITAPDTPNVSSQLMCPAGTSVPLSNTGAESVRITVFRESSTAESGLEFVCDRVIPLVTEETDKQPAIYAPLAEGELATIVAETWTTAATPQQDAGAQADAQLDGGTDAPAQTDAQHDAGSDTPVQTDAPPQTDAPGQADGQKDAQQDAQTDGTTQTDAAPQTDAGAPTDAGHADGGTTGGARLLGSGRVRHVDVRGAEPRTIIVDRARGFSCALGIANVTRAFHTATLLPDGRVALIGGLSLGAGTPLEIGDRHSVKATNMIEIYDPETQTFANVTDDKRSTSPVRAFHTAYLLTSDPGKAKILLVGGVTPGGTSPSEEDPVVELDGTVLLDVAPLTQTTAAAPEIVEIDLQTNTVTRSVAPTPAPASRFMHGSTEDPPAPLASTYPLVAGGAGIGKGANELPTPVMSLEFEDAVGSKPGTTRVGDVPLAGTGRLGATVTDIGTVDTGGGAKPTWLVLGGNLWSAEANLQAEMAEYVSVTVTDGIPQAATSALANIPVLPVTAFHTTTPVRDADGKLAILVAGGFVIQPSVLAVGQMAAFDPVQPGSGLPIMSLITSPGQVTALSTPAGFKAVGFHDAVRLADSSVLVTGGSPYQSSSSSLPKECPWNYECRPDGVEACPAKTQQDSRQCALCQAARYFHDKNVGQRRVEPEGNLQIARFGHRSTLLWDGRVLISGGIHSRIGSSACSGTDVLMMLKSAELYNPQRSDEDPISLAADPNNTSARLTARAAGQGSSDPCCTCPSSVSEAKKLAKQCSGTQKSCVWQLD